MRSPGRRQGLHRRQPVAGNEKPPWRRYRQGGESHWAADMPDSHGQDIITRMGVRCMGDVFRKKGLGSVNECE